MAGRKEKRTQLSRLQESPKTRVGKNPTSERDTLSMNDERLNEIRKRNDRRKKFHNAGDATLVATTDDIDYLLSLLPQLSSSEPRRCQHGLSVSDSCDECIAYAEAERELVSSSEPEVIRSAAVRKNGIVYVCWAHTYHELKRMNLDAPDDVLKHSAQGFMTNMGRFVGRKEAFLIAQAAGQIKHKHGGADTLYSEDLRETVSSSERRCGECGHNGPIGKDGRCWAKRDDQDDDCIQVHCGHRCVFPATGATSNAVQTCLRYAEMIESQNDINPQVENWSDAHYGQVYAAKQLAAMFAATGAGEQGGVVEQAVYVSKHPLYLRCNVCGLKIVRSLQCPREDGQLVIDSEPSTVTSSEAASDAARPDRNTIEALKRQGKN
jgi:hypothetical protein